MSNTPQSDKKLKVLLVEDDTSACAEFVSYIDSLSDTELVGVTNSSFKAFELVRSAEPDALILDLELHEGSGNGLLLLNDMRTLDSSKIPYTIITTNNTSNTTFESARRLGADFIFTKHQANYSPRSAVDFLRLMAPVIHAHRNNSSSVPATADSIDIAERQKRKKICAEFDILGMSNKNLGYKYLADAVSITMDKPTPNIPFILSKQYEKTAASIERAMQHAIERTWNSVPIDDLTANYTAHINPDREMPTVMEFVTYYADKLSRISF